MNKEQIYDSQIHPLMAQIIGICQANKIAMLADFAIGHPDAEGLKCTTTLTSDEYNPPAEMVRACAILAPRKSAAMMLTTEHADGSKTMTAILG